MESRTAFTVCHVITSLDAGGAETMLAKLLLCSDPERVTASVVSLTPGGDLAPGLPHPAQGRDDGMRNEGLHTVTREQPFHRPSAKARPVRLPYRGGTGAFAISETGVRRVPPQA